MFHKEQSEGVNGRVSLRTSPNTQHAVTDKQLVEKVKLTKSAGLSLTGYQVNKEWPPVTMCSSIWKMCRWWWGVEEVGCGSLWDRNLRCDEDSKSNLFDWGANKFEEWGRRCVQYVSGLLWREEDPSLWNNYDMAKKSLKSLEKTFQNNPEIRGGYTKSIQDSVILTWMMLHCWRLLLTLCCACH